jgi:hypothetical protein
LQRVMSLVRTNPEPPVKFGLRFRLQARFVVLALGIYEWRLSGRVGGRIAVPSPCGPKNGFSACPVAALPMAREFMTQRSQWPGGPWGAGAHCGGPWPGGLLVGSGVAW